MWLQLYVTIVSGFKTKEMANGIGYVKQTFLGMFELRKTITFNYYKIF